MGNKNLSNAYFSTTSNFYHQSPNLNNSRDASPPKQMKPFESHFKLAGNDNFQKTTQNTDTYLPKHGSGASPDTSFERMLRDNHFSLGHTKAVD